MTAFASIPGHTQISVSARIGEREVRLSCNAHPDNAAHVLEFCLDRIRARLDAANSAAC
jgi:hypothetical protein